MTDPRRGRKLTIREGLAQIPGPDGQRSATVLRRGTLDVKVSAPRGRNEQTPHGQDELYVIVAGEGYLVCEGKRERFGPGDALFVPAGAEHRFEGFSDYLTVWVIFYGPQGGENAV